MLVSLRTPTPREWAEIALKDFDTFLLDHAACERKASAVGMSFVVRYPDRREILDPMIHFAREELEHFHQIYRLAARRGLTLPNDSEDEYVNCLMREVRSGRDERFLDRLLISSVIEARGTERLGLIAETIGDPDLRELYARLARAEGHHQNLFVDLAGLYFAPGTIRQRLDFFLDLEDQAIASVPFRSAVH
jgi:tRNA-(ms[2]io[6]A)-hydroxylase